MDNKEYLDKLREFIAEEVRKEVAKQLQGLLGIVSVMQENLNRQISVTDSAIAQTEERIKIINESLIQKEHS